MVTSLTAESLKEACEKIKIAKPVVKVCLTSHHARQKIKFEIEKKFHNIYTSEIGIFGIEIVGAIEIESDNAFFFESMEDADSFLTDVRELKKQGLSWKVINHFFELKMKGKI